VALGSALGGALLAAAVVTAWLRRRTECSSREEEARRLVPSIPELGHDQIPIRDELHLEREP